MGLGFQMYVSEKMKILIKKLKTALHNHARYIATRNEIARLPLDVALDLGLSRGDANEIARKAVWN
ncbi:hypothetical protein [Pseudorhodobacter sp.]|nr:hypothetical protein [Pseudorhodobacter sp.]